MRRFRSRLPVLLLGLLLAAGCGGDDDGGGGGTQPTPTEIEVEPGTWRINVGVTGSAGLCTSVAAAFAEEYDGPQETLICGPLDPETLLGSLGGIDCNFGTSGNTISASCSGSTQFLGCTVDFAGAGSGTVGNDRRSVSFSMPVNVTTSGGEGCETAPCTVNVVLTAVWLSSEGCAGASAASIPADYLLGRVLEPLLAP